MTVRLDYDADLRVPDKNSRMQPRGARIILRNTPYGLKDRIKGGDGHPGLPGRSWAPAPQRFWHVPATVETAGTLQRFLTELDLAADIHPHVLELMARAEESQAAQANKHRDDLPEIPGRYCTCPEGPKRTDDDGEDTQGICDRCGEVIESWMHQRQAFWWAAPREGAGLQMDMGTGKSKVTVALADRWQVDRMVIVAPPRAVKIWPRQFRQNSLRPWVVVNHGGRRRDKKLRPKPSMRQRIDAALEGLQEAERHGAPYCLVVNYEAAWQEPLRTFLLKTLPARAGGRYGLAVADESHKTKAPGGKWSLFMEELSKHADRRLNLTGTMMPHDELDVYAQMRFQDPGVFGTSYATFKSRFFAWGGFEGRQLDRDEETGSPFVTDALEREFHQKLGSATIVIEDDVLDLPPALDQPPIIFPLGEQASRHYADLLEDWQTQVGDVDENDPLQVSNALSQMIRLAQVTSGHLPIPDPYNDGPKAIETIGSEKRNALKDWLEDVPAGEPVVVFARFKHDLACIREVAEAAGRRYREISGRSADALDEDGRMVADCDLAGVQLQAGGVGIDLTRARHALYYSLDFNLGDYKQSRKRVHRPGQRNRVSYHYLVAQGTIDQVILHALRNRDDVVRRVVGALKRGDFDPEGWDT